MYNILMEFGIPMKFIRLIKMYLDEIYSTVQVGKNLSNMLPIKMGLKKRRCFTTNCFSTLLYSMPLGRFR